MRKRRNSTGGPGSRTAGAAGKSAQLRRRDFVQAGLVGAAATLAADWMVVPTRAVAEKDACKDVPLPDCPQPVVPADVGVIDPSLETWTEPWVWRPGDWPGQQLDLNVVENENPGPAVGLGNPNAILFSYGANTPGPTIRMKGDEILYVKLRNLLGQDFNTNFVGPYPDTAPGGRPPGLTSETIDAAARRLGNERREFCLGEHTNGIHAVRVTNLHTHGLHVSPSRNPNGTHSDNVILRILSQADFRRRERISDTAPCRFMDNPEELYFLRDDEQAGEADYEFRLGDVQRRKRERENEKRAREGKPLLPPQKHPAGTFWYHPHAHGATWTQVSSGMAGYLIVEGDIDEAINKALTRKAEPDPEVKTGDWDYRERLMFFQRVLFSNRSRDRDAQTQSLRVGATPLVNGDANPAVIQMRRGAVERWRAINGSVDGRGYKRFMVLEGQFVVRGRHLFEVESEIRRELDPNTGQERTVLAGTIDPDQPIDPVLGLPLVESRKQDLHQLAIDGITLIERHGGTEDHPGYRYRLKNLAQQNPSENPLAHPDEAYKKKLWEQIEKKRPELFCEPPTELQKRWRKRLEAACAWLAGLESVYKDRDSIRNTFIRPNEFYMGPANRTDVLFEAPRRAQHRVGDYAIYTVLAKAVVVHSDTPQEAKQNVIQQAVNDPSACFVPPAPFPEDVVVAHILVDHSQEPCPEGGIGRAREALREVPVQEYLHPPLDAEVSIRDEKEARARNVRRGQFRTRIVTYSGWGNADTPLVSTYPGDPSSEAFAKFIEEDRKRRPPRRKEECRDRADCREGENHAYQDLDESWHGPLENLVYAQYEGTPWYVLLPPNIRTMAVKFNNAAVDCERACAEHPDDFPYRHPELPRKFNPSDPYRARMLEDTAEEWAIYNLTDLLWGNTTTERKSLDDPVDAYDDPTRPDYKQPPTQFQGHYVSYAIPRAEGSRHFLDNFDFRVVTKGIDHPFHIHQNPFWVTRIEIPDENGDLHNILEPDEARWMDTLWIPRHRGRIVMRSRFPDYVGAYVHHCHILQHEDNGMMHVIEATPFRDQSNYHAQDHVTSVRRSSEETNHIYKRPGRQESVVESTRFFDSSPGTGQLYPGFEITPRDPRDLSGRDRKG